MVQKDFFLPWMLDGHYHSEYTTPRFDFVEKTASVYQQVFAQWFGQMKETSTELHTSPNIFSLCQRPPESLPPEPVSPWSLRTGGSSPIFSLLPSLRRAKLCQDVPIPFIFGTATPAIIGWRPVFKCLHLFSDASHLLQRTLASIAKGMGVEGFLRPYGTGCSDVLHF